MNINPKNTDDYIDKQTYPNCDINCIHIQIKNLNKIVSEMSSEISDTSWINDQEELDKLIFNATAERTINKVVNEILSKVSNGLNDEIGEYLVSYSAQNVLVSHYNHTKIPLAELLKEKVSGNPGFDFHTISEKRFLIFGEAKFSLSDTPRAIALDQIGNFIDLKKDYAELNSLRTFIDEETHSNIVAGRKGYAAAFSFNAKNIDNIFKNALESEIIEEIAKHNELFLIAIEVC